MIVAVDFDGTLVEHAYPQIGAEIPGAFDWLLRLQNAGVLLILWTMRDRETLGEAVTYCLARGVSFWGINGNPEQEETGWSSSPKAYAHLLIDDTAVGCPLVTPPGRRPHVDWALAGPMLWNRLGLRPEVPVPDPVRESQDLIRSLVRPRRAGDLEQVVDVHGCTWTEDSGAGWSSPTCEESPLATRTDIEIAAGPLVAVERG